MRIGLRLPRNWPDTCGTTTLSKFLRRLLLGNTVNCPRPNEATEIFFIGIGNAFYGVANLLINRGRMALDKWLKQQQLTKIDTLYKRVNGVISFVAENPVRAIASHTQVWLSRWYKDVSVAFSRVAPCLCFIASN